jgi:hypothetical protein
MANCANRKLVLKDLHLGINAAKEIVSILEVNEKIAHLDLSKNNLHDEGMVLLMKSICQNDSIVHLNLSQNSISPDGAAKMFKYLSTNHALISLDFSNNENIQKNKLGKKSLLKLATYLETT